MSDTLSLALAEYLAKKLDAGDLTVHDLARIPGGASRETYRFIARYGGRERRLILRRDPTASLIETERSTEYRAYEAFHKLGLPVPEPIALELGVTALERPFFVMAEVENAFVGSILAPDPYGAHRDKIGHQFWSNLGRIAGADPGALGLADFEGAKDARECWRHEIARWEKVIDEDEGEPEPIARAAIRWLKLDMDRVVAVGAWIEHPNLGKVDEVGFADLIPGSGHGTGGWVHVGSIEVYGKTVPRGPN